MRKFRKAILQRYCYVRFFIFCALKNLEKFIILISIYKLITDVEHSRIQIDWGTDLLISVKAEQFFSSSPLP